MLRFGAILALLTLLTGCFQAEMKVEILSSEDGRATTTITMARNMYTMLAASGGSDNEFCDDGEITLTEESAICVSVKNGTIAELVLAAGENNQEVPVTVLDNGNLRVAFPIGELYKSAPGDMPNASESAATAAMMGQMLAGSTITITIAGKKIVETNMELAEDGKSASFTTDTLNIVTQSDTLPDELYAIVDPD